MTTSPIRSINFLKFFSNHSNQKNHHKDYFIYEKIAYKQLLLKYFTIPLIYEINIINNIIYNEKSHIVAKFKDYLILDDTSEFLKRYYKNYESGVRLPKFYEYYETYSKIFPNYTGLPEGQYIYKNIQKKQIMIDIQEQMEIENKNCSKNKQSNEKIKDVFDTEVIDSILNQTNKEDIELLFNVNRDNILIEDKKFTQEIIDIINTIEKYENAINNDHSHINIENITNSNTFNVRSPLGYNIMKKNKINNSNINNSNNSTTNSKKSQINYSNNDSYLKIYQSNFIQIIKFKNVPYEINTSDLKENNKDSKNLSRKISKTETREASKKFYTPNNFD